MLKPIPKNFSGLITITGAAKSGKSELAEFLINSQEKIMYIATSKPRENDPEWEQRINIHRSRRPNSWKFVEHPNDICNVIESVVDNESILLDSLGGLVEQYLKHDDSIWESFQNKFIKCVLKSNVGIIVVAEEIGWGVVPATSIGHLFRERHTQFCSLLNRHSVKKWLAINGTAIDLETIGYLIP